MEGNSGGGGGGGNDVELLCKTLQVEHKLFYFDLKENPRGRYLKISEKTSATRSTIIVPSNGISWFLDLFNYYLNSHDQQQDDVDDDLFSKELQLDTKARTHASFFGIQLCYSFLPPSPFIVLIGFGSQLHKLQVFYFDVGENRRGRFLKVTFSSYLSVL